MQNRASVQPAAAAIVCHSFMMVATPDARRPECTNTTAAVDGAVHVWLPVLAYLPASPDSQGFGAPNRSLKLVDTKCFSILHCPQAPPAPAPVAPALVVSAPAPAPAPVPAISQPGFGWARASPCPKGDSRRRPRCPCNPKPLIHPRNPPLALALALT